ncbi:sulfatase-like hydrolase/transferase [Microbacterium esteraromaticum]|uniref:Sulfatase-like hydrolase/transferase n=1 Tax=Microbacterium esteraromaticum TaxID=57043 RepID=A0A7D7WB32_9MICO|nr:sulfatase-like hydrolase/transferase [Microbacterium esteraromaticum]QMU96357.1 sulfatase-like hydrolase/transferase [Microbacterium esteraromaticum]
MTAARPNLVVIVSDDQGPWALGAAGNHEIRTPVLDELAERGVRLERFFSASPVCSPARASLLTGRIPSAHGVHDYLDGAHAGPAGRDHLEGVTTLTDALADAGYRLGLSGKWHLGASDAPRRGFVHWYALEGGGSPYHDAVMYRDAQPEHVTGYLTDVIADDAVAFIDAEQAHDAPFFLAVNFTAPHKPFAGQHPDEYTALYRDCAFDTCPQEEPHPWLQTLDGAPIGGEPDAREALIGYFAAVTAMDAAIGRILDALRRNDREDDTIVVFLSDNGFSCGQHGFWGKGNGTFPMNMYDESVMVPFIISAPWMLPCGVVDDRLHSAYDLPATLMELAGLDESPFESGPGRSFAGALRGESPSPRSEQRPVVVHSEYGPVRMIRTHDRKYVHRHPHGPHELYDLAADPRERENLADLPSHSDEVSRLRRMLRDWFAVHSTADADGQGLPVFGAGQTRPLGDDPLGAFALPGWDDAR